MTRRFSLCVLAFLPLAALTIGCGEQAQQSDYDAPEAAEALVEEAAAEIEAGPEVLQALAKIDLVDGTEDHVVSNCPACKLAMEGSAEHAMHVGDYALHFCSEEEKNAFAQQGADALLALAVDEASEPDATQ
jgi:Fe-S oxidoreductase